MKTYTITREVSHLETVKIKAPTKAQAIYSAECLDNKQWESEWGTKNTKILSAIL